MNKEDTFEWVQGETSKLYWEFRDDLDDEGAEKLSKLLSQVENDLTDIVLEHITA